MVHLDAGIEEHWGEERLAFDGAKVKVEQGKRKTTHKGAGGRVERSAWEGVKWSANAWVDIVHKNGLSEVHEIGLSEVQKQILIVVQDCCLSNVRMPINNKVRVFGTFHHKIFADFDEIV